MTGLFDSHCHLDAPEFDADREAVWARAKAAGVCGTIVPAVEPASWEATLASTREGERWAALYANPNVTADARLLGEARRLHACFHARAAAGVATAGAGGAVMGGAVTGAPTRRLTSKLWTECVAVACGFHACVVAQVRDDL